MGRQARPGLPRVGQVLAPHMPAVLAAVATQGDAPGWDQVPQRDHGPWAKHVYQRRHRPVNACGTTGWALSPDRPAGGFGGIGGPGS
jgi:hypothetical protein